MTEFSIIEARPWHCGSICRRLRLDHQKAIAKFGINSHMELRARFDASAFRRAWFIDGRLAALGGVTGSALSATGFVWLCLTEDAIKYPLATIKETKRQLAEIMVVKRTLVTAILDGDEISKKFAIFMGFVPGELEPAMSKFGRRELERYCDNPSVRVPIGNGFATTMAYREMA